MGLSFIKCPDCGTKNMDQQYCTGCGAMLDTALRRRQQEERKREKRRQEAPACKDSWAVQVIKRFEGHQSPVVRFIFTVLNAVWLFCAMAVGGLIAAVIALAAG